MCVYSSWELDWIYFGLPSHQHRYNGLMDDDDDLGSCAPINPTLPPIVIIILFIIIIVLMVVVVYVMDVIRILLLLLPPPLDLKKKFLLRLGKSRTSSFPIPSSQSSSPSWRVCSFVMWISGLVAVDEGKPPLFSLLRIQIACLSTRPPPPPPPDHTRTFTYKR